MQGSGSLGSKNNKSFPTRPGTLCFACAALRVSYLEDFLLALCDAASHSLAQSAGELWHLAKMSKYSFCVILFKKQDFGF